MGQKVKVGYNYKEMLAHVGAHREKVAETRSSPTLVDISIINKVRNHFSRDGKREVFMLEAEYQGRRVVAVVAIPNSTDKAVSGTFVWSNLEKAAQKALSTISSDTYIETLFDITKIIVVPKENVNGFLPLPAHVILNALSRNEHW